MKAIIIVLLMLSAPVAAADWLPGRVGAERGEVSTFHRPAAHSRMKEFKGVVELQASLVSVLAVLTAIDSFPDWVFQAKQARRLFMGNRRERERLYIQFNGIWPVSDRDVVLATTLRQGDAGSVVVHSQSVTGKLKSQPGMVRIPAFENQFILTPLDAGWVRVEFTAFVDPGGKLPAWLANWVAMRAPLETLLGLKDKLKQPRFAGARRQDLPPIAGIEDLRL